CAMPERLAVRRNIDTKELLWPRLEPRIKQRQPAGYDPPPVAGKDGQQGYLFHSPLRRDDNPSFIIFPDSPEKPGGFFDRGTGDKGTLYDLLLRLNQQAPDEEAAAEQEEGPSSN